MAIRTTAVHVRRHNPRAERAFIPIAAGPLSDQILTEELGERQGSYRIGVETNLWPAASEIGMVEQQTVRVQRAFWRRSTVNEKQLLARITIDPKIFGGKPIIRGRRLAVEHVLGMLAAGDTPDIILAGYPWLEPEDIQACLVYAHKLVGHERIELAPTDVLRT